MKDFSRNVLLNNPNDDIDESMRHEKQQQVKADQLDN